MTIPSVFLKREIQETKWRPWVVLLIFGILWSKTNSQSPFDFHSPNHQEQWTYFEIYFFLKNSLSRFQVLVLNKSFVFSCLVLFARDPTARYTHWVWCALNRALWWDLAMCWPAFTGGCAQPSALDTLSSQQNRDTHNSSWPCRTHPCRTHMMV